MKRRAVCIVLLAAGWLCAQDDTREIWDTGFRQKRPVSTKSAQTPTRPVVYKPVPMSPFANLATEAGLGLTVWRLRRPRNEESKDSRLLVQDTSGDPPTEFVSERTDISEPLLEGERIRLSVEVPRIGFLYVIDQEQFANGSLTDPYLIYPVLNIRNGDNAVAPGRITEIPPEDGKVRALRVQRHGPDHVGEKLTLVVSDQPLADLPIADRQTKLSPALLERLERFGVLATMRMDLAHADSVPLTGPEKVASANANCLLTQSDPMPESIFAGTPRSIRTLIVSVPLIIR